MPTYPPHPTRLDIIAGYAFGRDLNAARAGVRSALQARAEAGQPYRMSREAARAYVRSEIAHLRKIEADLWAHAVAMRFPLSEADLAAAAKRGVAVNANREAA